MSRADVRVLAARSRDYILVGAPEQALACLSPTVTARTPFPLLDLAGRIIAEAGGQHPADFTAVINGLAATGAIGAWPLIGSTLSAAYLPHAMAHAFSEARRFIVMAEVWHATDAIGERVAGRALLTYFGKAVAQLEGWRTEPSAWLRRAVGVAAHYYVQREREALAEAASLLDLLAPLFEERDTAAAKGIGWGLRTIGKYHPTLLEDWLHGQLAVRRPRRLMLRKAITHLPGAVRAELL